MWGNFGDESPLLAVDKAAPVARKWRLAAGASTLVALVLAVALALVASERSALLAANSLPGSQTGFPVVAQRAVPTVLLEKHSLALSKCTASGIDLYETGTKLGCCEGLVPLQKPCFPAGGLSVCEFCVDPVQAPKECTPAGMDVFSNPTGQRLPCCPGFIEEAGPCREYDQCMFCQPSSLTPTGRMEYPPSMISVDPATPQDAVDKHKKAGMSLILSDEFKDLGRTKSIFVFEDIPYGVPGNTGDVNIVSIYASDTISLLPEGGMRLSAYLAPEDEKVFMEGWNGTYNTNWGSDVSKWAWHAPKVRPLRSLPLPHSLTLEPPRPPSSGLSLDSRHRHAPPPAWAATRVRLATLPARGRAVCADDDSQERPLPVRHDRDEHQGAQGVRPVARGLAQRLLRLHRGVVGRVPPARRLPVPLRPVLVGWRALTVSATRARSDRLWDAPRPRGSSERGTLALIAPARRVPSRALAPAGLTARHDPRRVR